MSTHTPLRALGLASLLTSVLAWEKTHNWANLNAYPLVIQPDRLLSVTGNISYPGPPAEGPLILTTTADQIASCIVDYGAVFAGNDFYNIAIGTNNAILRITYSESLDFIDDGDIVYDTVIKDHNTIRQRNYTLDSATTRIENFLTTTFRYTKLELLTPGVGSFRIGSLANTYAQPPTYIAGNFSGEGPGWLQNISKIFNYGARTLSSTMLEADVYDDAYRFSGAGFLLDDETGGVFHSLPYASNYSLEVNAHIVRDGFGVYMLSDSVQDGYLWSIHSESAARPNLVQLIYGKSEATGTVVGEATSPIPITDGDWWRFRFGIYNNVTGVASVNGTAVAEFTIPPLINGVAPRTQGSYGFTTLADQRVILSNLTGTDANGRVIVNTEFQGAKSQLQVSAEAEYYGQAGNTDDTILTGLKNRRGVDVADTVISARSMYYSWNQNNYVLGNMHIFGANQYRDGRLMTWQWPTLPAKTFYPSSNTPPAFYFGFNYFTEFAIALQDYVMYSNDQQAVTFTANQQYPSQFLSLTGNMRFIETYTNSDGLIVIPEGSELSRDWASWYNSTSPGYLPYEGMPTGIVGKPNILWYKCLRSAAYLANEIQGNYTLGTHWNQLADKVYTAINSQLYNAEKGYYYISTERKTGIAQDLNGMAVLYGVAPMDQKQRIINTMNAALYDDSKVGKYMAYTKDAEGYPYLAVPYAAYYHAAAAFEICDTKTGMDLIHQIWYPMISEGNFFSKGYWEDLEPTAATDLISSRSSGVVELLGGYVMGVKPTSPGHATYDIRPQMGDLDRINGTVPTARGGIDLDLHKDAGSGFLNWTIVPSFYPNDGTLYFPSTADEIQVNGAKVSTSGSATNLPYGVESVKKNVTDGTIKLRLTATTLFNVNGPKA